MQPFIKVGNLPMEGETQKVMGKETGCSKSAVSKLKKVMLNGKAVLTRDSCSLDRIFKQTLIGYSERIHKERTAAGIIISKATLHRSIRDKDVNCYIFGVKPLLNQRQCL